MDRVLKNKRDTLLPILQSSLPPFEKMLPYLQQIESNRCHSNFGKLFRLFEARIAEFYQVPIDNVAIFCNGTLALVTGLLAYELPRNSYCLMPSWTFSATPASALLAGLTPYFLDVDIQSQALTPEIVLKFIEEGHLDRADISAILAVSPFGSPIPRKQWDDFTAETKIPVIIDSAASFDTVHTVSSMAVGSTPQMISMHATKIFGIGEGGMLVSTNKEFIQKARGISNFGFDISRVSSYPGMNSKMSEYQAAIGLGVLDSWEETREKRLAVTQNYLSIFKNIKLWMSNEWLTSTCNAIIPNKSHEIRDYLVAHNIEARVWWGKGCHTHPAYMHLPRVKSLPNTNYLSHAMLGLPFSIDTTRDEIEMIYDIINDYRPVISSEKCEIETEFA